MRRRWVRDALILAGAFVGATLLAMLFGATNLGTALTFGQLAFMGAVVALVLLRRRPTGAATAADPPAAEAKRAPPPPPKRARRRR
jgi:hypothetical protein